MVEISVEQLLHFFDQYGPSARHAYTECSNTEEYEAPIRSELRTWKLERLNEFCEKDGLSLFSDETVTHRLLLLRPSADRREYKAVVPTPHLMSMIHSHFAHKRSTSIDILYKTFTYSSHTAASGGYLLDNALPRIFSRGGHWPVFPMTQLARHGPRFSHWKTPAKSQTDASSCQWITLGASNTESFLVSSTSDRPDAPTSALGIHDFFTNQLLQAGLYKPYRENEATHDGFIYCASNQTALIMQSTVAKSKHSVSKEGINKLKNLGVKSGIFVAVMPPMNLLVDYSFPKEHADFFTECYALFVESIPLDSPAPSSVQ